LSCLRVDRHPGRGRDRRMWVYEGLKSDSEPDFFVPVHYFHYNEFRPEVYRLDDDDYFDPVPSTYREHFSERSKALKKHRDEAGFRYRYFLGYEALLICLSLNELASAPVFGGVAHSVQPSSETEVFRWDAKVVR
jgi:hypothetical protein